MFFFFKQKTAYEMRISDWSSDVCSSDLIFEDNASYKRIEGEEQTLKTTEDLFQQSLHEYTITHAIEDKNVLRFHVDYFKPDGEHPVKPCEPLAKRAVVEAILARHDTAPGGCRFNALLAPASINDAIRSEEHTSEL